MRADQIAGCILGTAVGDAIGLPYEGLSRQRAVRLLGSPHRHRLLFGRGMVSDDTEHTCMVAQAWIGSRGDLAAFRSSLAWRLKWWLLALPAAVGFATLRAVGRLWLGWGTDHSGVFSAGNGPAMRSALLGVVVDDLQVLREFVRVSSRLTHTDPRAEIAALAVAIAAHFAARGERVTPEEYQSVLSALLDAPTDEFLALIERMIDSVKRRDTTVAFAEQLGLSRGASGYSYQSVPVALHAWLSHPNDCRAAVMAAVACGGDTDTTAAIAGGIVGAGVGKEGIPQDWLAGLCEWPRSVRWLERLAADLADAEVRIPPQLPIFGVLARNLLFLVVIVWHGMRRLAPPY